MTTLGLKNVNMLSKGRYDNIVEPSKDELWAVETETYSDEDGNWYRVYPDGWCEQGGQSDATGNRTVNFLKPFKNNLYTTSATAWFGNQLCYVTIGEPRNSTQLQLKPSHTSSLISIFWQACGYIA